MDFATCANSHEWNPFSSDPLHDLVAGGLVDTRTGRGDSPLALALAFAFSEFVDEVVDFDVGRACCDGYSASHAVSSIALVSRSRSSSVIVLEWWCVHNDSKDR